MTARDIVEHIRENTKLVEAQRLIEAAKKKEELKWKK